MEGSLSISGQVDAAGVTSFTNEACEGVMVLGSQYVPSSLVYAQPDLQDLKRYFERPRLIARGTIAFGTRNLIYGTDIDPTTLSNFFPQWYQRLSGVYAVRFTLNFRVQVAATAFHQGLLVAGWQYQTALADIVNTTVNYDRGSTPASVTNLPHVRMDLSESTMVELKVPFLNEFEYFPVKGTTSSVTEYGRFSFTSVLPVVSVSSISVPTYEVYMFMSDFELYGVANNNDSSITLQSGGSVMKKELKDSRLLSKSLENVAKIGNFVSRNIPMLSGVAGTVAWAADTAAGVAKYFGYSRPLIQDPVLRTFRTPYTGESNVDVAMAGFSVGLMQSNTLAHSGEVGGTDVDEMALSFVTSQWSQVCSGNVLTSDTHNKVIYACPISPACLWYRSPATAPYCNKIFPASSFNLISNTGNSFLPTSLMNISSFFRLWRGTMKFRFTFAKTKFHGGRYMVSYAPSFNTVNFPGDVATSVKGPEVIGGAVQPYGYSQIMDLRDGNVFEFVVPFICESPYVPYYGNTGAISVVCIDPLQANSSVTSTVPFLVEVCGGEDFELADYAGPYHTPMPNGIIYQQSGGKVSTTIVKPSQLTVGEEVKSVKQLIQSPYWYNAKLAANSTDKMIIPPWFVHIPSTLLKSVTTSPAPTTVKLEGHGFAGSALAKCYTYARGGTDFHAYHINSNAVGTVIEQIPSEGLISESGFASSYGFRTGTGSTPKALTFGETALHVRLPAFQPRVRIPTTSLDNLGFRLLSDPSLAIRQDVRGHYDRIVIVNNASYELQSWYSRAAADDATLSVYIGPTPQYIPNTLNTNQINDDWYK